MDYKPRPVKHYFKITGFIQYPGANTRYFRFGNDDKTIWSNTLQPLLWHLCMLHALKII